MPAMMTLTLAAAHEVLLPPHHLPTKVSNVNRALRNSNHGVIVPDWEKYGLEVIALLTRMTPVFVLVCQGIGLVVTRIWPVKCKRILIVRYMVSGPQAPLPPL